MKLWEAARDNKIAELKALLATGAEVDEKHSYGYTALMKAAWGGHEEVIKVLLAAGAKVNEKANDGTAALMMAANKARQEVVKLLLVAGAKVDEKANDGKTALMWAAERGHQEVVKLLLTAGAKANEKDNNGFTVLMYATERGHEEVVKDLLAAGAEVSEKENNGVTALILAAGWGHQKVVNVLLAAGAKVDEKRGRDDRTALMSAASRGHKEVIEILLAAGAKVDEKDINGYTALMLAAQEGHKEAIQSLLAAGANVNENYKGETALHRAVAAPFYGNAHLEVAKILLVAGAKLEAKNLWGRTALDNAKLRNFVKMVALLEEAVSKPAGMDIKPTADHNVVKMLNNQPVEPGKPAAGGAGAPAAVRGVAEQELNQERLQSIKPAKGGSGGAASSTSHYKVIPFDSLELTGKTLGAGGFGVVKQATWSFMDVAVKQLKVSRLSDESLAEFEAEAKIHAGLNHLNIVRLYGACIESFKYCMVMELMVGGSLYDVLHNAKELPWEIRSSIAKDIAVGLTYLHEHGILHRDLKSLNVLLDDRMRAKLSDFGLSKVKTETMASTAASEKGTLCWMAPELFKRGAKHNELSDIYALGMVLWELASREIPFKDSHGNSALLMQWVKDGERDEIPAATPPKFAVLIGQCWAQNPSDRPKSAREVAEALVKN